MQYVAPIEGVDERSQALSDIASYNVEKNWLADFATVELGHATLGVFKGESCLLEAYKSSSH